MKKVLKIITILIIFILIQSFLCYTFATDTVWSIDTSKWNPNNSVNRKAGTVFDSVAILVSRILGFIQIIGAFLSSVTLAYIGFRTILSILPGERHGPHFGHNKNEHLDNFLYPFLLGVVLLTGGSTLIKFLLEQLTNI